MEGILREPRRSPASAVIGRHLGGELPVHAHYRARHRHDPHGLFSRLHRLRRVGGDPGPDAGRLEFPWQAESRDGAGPDQLGHSRDVLFLGGPDPSSRLLGDFQRHDAVDGGVDRRAVLQRAAHGGQGQRRVPGTARRRHPDPRRPGGLRPATADGRPRLPDGHHLLRLRRIPHPALARSSRRVGQPSLRPGEHVRRHSVPAAAVRLQRHQPTPGQLGWLERLAVTAGVGAGVHRAGVHPLFPVAQRHRAGQIHDRYLPDPALRRAVGGVVAG